MYSQYYSRVAFKTKNKTSNETINTNTEAIITMIRLILLGEGIAVALLAEYTIPLDFSAVENGLYSNMTTDALTIPFIKLKGNRSVGIRPRTSAIVTCM